MQCLVDIIELSDKAVVTPCMVSSGAALTDTAAFARFSGGCGSFSTTVCATLQAGPPNYPCSTSFATTASGGGCPTTSASAHCARPEWSQVGWLLLCAAALLRRGCLQGPAWLGCAPAAPVLALL